jgi:hypothetical protein
MLLSKAVTFESYILSCMKRLFGISLFYDIVQENQLREGAGAVSGPDLSDSRAPGHAYALYFRLCYLLYPYSIVW